MGYEGQESWEQVIEELEQEFEEAFEAPPEHHGHQHHHHHEAPPEWDGGEFSDYASPEKPDFSQPEISPTEFQPELSPAFAGILGDLDLSGLGNAFDPSASAPAATPDASSQAAPAPPPLAGAADPPPQTDDTDATKAASGARIVIDGDLRVTPAGSGIEVYFTLKNAGDADLPEGSGLITYLQVVGDDGNVLVDRRVGMGQALAQGATHFGGDRLAVAPQHSTVFVYTNYKDDGTYDDLKSADYNPR